MKALNPSLERREVQMRGALALAHVGDGVYELMVRTKVCASEPLTNAGQHRRVLEYVSAAAQSAAAARILPYLDDEEREYFMRGRNAHPGNMPRHASPADYHAATGLETLFGALWLLGGASGLRNFLKLRAGRAMYAR